MKIRDRLIWPNVIPSPMSGVTDRPFRQLIHELAKGRVGMTVTEFVSVDALQRYTARSFRQMRTFSGEHPVCIQVFGAKPESVAAGAAQMQEAGADFVEINGGCPVPKVIGKGGGSSLLKDLPRLRKMLQLTRKSVDIPLFLKVRIGWDDENINILDSLKIAEDEGVELFTIHGRTRVQGYKGLADWNWINKAAEVAKIPVVGNGDIRSAQEAKSRLLEFPALSGVGVGRSLMHNPFMLAQVADLWEGKTVGEPSGPEIHAMIARYAELLAEDGFSSHGVLGRLKQMLARLSRFIEPDASEFRLDLLHTEELEPYLEKLQRFFLEDYIKLGYKFQPGRVLNLNGKHSLEMEEGRQFK